MDPRDHRDLISYPCRWTFKVIGSDERLLRDCITETMKDHSHEVMLSRRSAQARFVSLEVSLEVPSEEIRLALYAALQTHDATKIVL